MGWHWGQFYCESTTQMHSLVVVVVVGPESVLCLSPLFGRVWQCGCSLHPPFHTPSVPPPALLLPPSVLLGRRPWSRSMPVHKYE